MSGKKTEILTDVSDAATNLPDPVRKGLAIAIGKMLGGLAEYSSAWMQRAIRSIEDTTTGRSTVADILAKGVAEEALKDPAIMQAAAEIYLPSTVRKVINKAQVARLAIDRASETSTDGAKAAAPDDDWMNAFMRFAEDASSDRLQDLLGRILAGEVVRPGSFSLSTVRTIGELDQSIAKDFSLVWAKSVGVAVDYSPEFRRGDWFARWKRLAEAGLMAVSDTVQFLPDFKPTVNGNALWTPMSSEEVFLTVYFNQKCDAQWRHIDFTRIGREIGSILAPPDYRANIREAGRKFSGKGVTRVELHSTGAPFELLYRAPA